MNIIEYTVGAELPDVTFTWLDSAGNILQFVTVPYTFSFRVATTPTFSKGVLGGSQTGITSADTAPNVTVSLTVGDLDTLVPGVYAGQLWARRTSDSKDRDPLPFLFLVKAAIT